MRKSHLCRMMWREGSLQGVHSRDKNQRDGICQYKDSIMSNVL